MKKIVAIVGSNADRSTNRQLLEYIKNRYASQANIELMEVRGLPIFQKTRDMVIPDQAKEMAKKIKEADGVIIATPEWDHSIPAILSSALAWLSYGVHPFMDKPVMITGASFGALGTSRAQAQLRQILDSPELQARIMPSSEFLLSHSLNAFDKEGQLLDDDQNKRLDSIFNDFLIFIDAEAKLSHTYADDLRRRNEIDVDYGTAEVGK
ncbi:NADPH-dependent FMN reductase [Lentilactobacillus sp. SPB1-3]|uniref:NADPH-dependent FMN reductase n=1 Tax=Lentilactobacillus terminaliae TaxID=3003483 RepID=A0ACD5DFB7_9LACO|nr:NADPH-dependent FMN reductase [Lentilactobacillus sp. SPB1-3]MCZ0976476.1 NAD(P)H-dependent oxidoreductase [Lentilactobacillus sp. SPB1-3]